MEQLMLNTKSFLNKTHLTRHPKLLNGQSMDAAVLNLHGPYGCLLMI